MTVSFLHLIWNVRPQLPDPALQKRAWAARRPIRCEDPVPRVCRRDNQPMTAAVYHRVEKTVKPMGGAEILPRACHWASRFGPMRFEHSTRALADWRGGWPMRTRGEHVKPRWSQWERRGGWFTPRTSRWSVPALRSLFMLLDFFAQFKGKGNGGSEAPKLRNHHREEQWMDCVTSDKTQKPCLKD